MTVPRTALIPRNADGVLRVIVIGRSSTVHKSAERIDDSHRLVRNYLARIYQGAMHLVLLGEEAGGQKTGRTTIVVAERLIATGRIDLVIAADRARIHRHRHRQIDFLQYAVDAGTHVMGVDDEWNTEDQQSY